MSESETKPKHMSLKRVVGLPGAVTLGLGSMVGTGVYVSLGLAAEHAGLWTAWAVLLAGGLAMCNGLSAAQLAAAHPVAGGTYEYGRVYLSPFIGLLAGVLFLIAKSASAATAAIAFANNLGPLLLEYGGVHLADGSERYAAVGLVVVLMVLTLAGLKKSNRVNGALVLAIIGTLVMFALAGIYAIVSGHGVEPEIVEQEMVNEWGGMDGLLLATALIFVAYTGYGRIATMGEEIKEPRKNIPVAVMLTVGVTAIIYLTITVVALRLVSVDVFYEASTQGRSLEEIARLMDKGWLVTVIGLGALLATVSVLLNLILGLSRVALAMARRGHLPSRLAWLDKKQQTPIYAVVFIAVVVGLLAGFATIKTAWSLSALTVLVYYGLTNMAALRLPRKNRLYPRFISVLGLLGCFVLSVFIEPVYWMVFGGVLAVTAVWYGVTKKDRAG
ncbi:putative amino acid permease YhdG [Poriferisphaera corsica]|uniref:Putative amino acid permease YhdG n=1 Tax=Poriferisphaera corsica TaxID=2528020 RepID=A0A517YWT1_9BACT|nr:APC family permease [Poriferisphaera corsica]QDU34670.1 putative amino acid permease YhdG [Poriferisphaera corsica]